MAGQSASFDDQDDLNASFTNPRHELWDRLLSAEIAGMLESLNTLPALARRCCIYKVSDDIRKSNEEAYTPQVISIGPFHRNNPKLQNMEDLKLRYLKSFRDRAEIKLEDLVSTIRGAEGSVRKCYSENIPLKSDDFVKMILVDASFIIEYFWKNKYDREILDAWLCNRMQIDLILLENQLPFFIIEKIYDTAFPPPSKLDPFIELCFLQFQNYHVQNHSPYFELEHEILHFTDLVRNFFIPPPEGRRRSSQKMKKIHSASQLARLGLKFKKRESSNINWPTLELKYANGVLEIPPLQLDSTTEIYARNLVAFEEFHYREDPYITDYYILLSMLIKTANDMDVLVQEQIIDNRPDGDMATSMIKKLPGNRFYQNMNSHDQHITEALNQLYKAKATKLQIMKDSLHITMAPLKREYFYNRWKGAATLGGILLVLLTIIQTVCALISVKNWN